VEITINIVIHIIDLNLEGWMPKMDAISDFVVTLRPLSILLLNL
jgi:hypothetical protein